MRNARRSELGIRPLQNQALDNSYRPTAVTSSRMKAVRQRDTEPELIVRRVLHLLGVRFRICPRDLPGRPDIANKSRQWAIFVHGCFWHGHEGCRLAKLPRTNSAFWIQKIEANRARDERKENAVRALGFRVEVIWQCEIRDERRLQRRMRSFVGTGASRRRRVP
jgi:DNA mismatch endonuclease Vsr